MNKNNNTVNTRLLSLDVMRGIIMILLAAESCHLCESVKELSSPGIAKSCSTILSQTVG
jgi:uncharacterized membrane protein